MSGAGGEPLALAPEEGAILENEPLARHTTWRIGGPARWFCRVRSESGLTRVLRRAQADGVPVALLGMGSNILAADAGFPGFVVRLDGEFLSVRIEGDVLEAGGGAALGGVCAAAARAGLSGLEAISGIPSSMGGAVRINAGAYGGEIFDVLESVRVVERGGEARTAAAEEIPHGYRWTRLCETGEIVASARMRLTPASREAIAEKTQAVALKRRGALPSEPNAGSVFKNPPGEFAGRLIEACGLKGARSGGAEISTRHANVIVNTGGATAEDVLALMERMREEVLARFAITLSPEVEMLGVEWKRR